MQRSKKNYKYLCILLGGGFIALNDFKLLEKYFKLKLQPMTDIAHIGLFIRRKRRACLLSQKELGLLIGVSQQQISRYETGRDRPCKSKFYLILCVFLLKNEDNKKNILNILLKSYFNSDSEKLVSFPASERIYK